MDARRFRDPREVAARLARLDEAHVAPLNAFVERLRAQRGGGESVPWFDPEGAGVATRVLLLAEAPGPRAVGPGSPRPKAKGSGSISPDNNDPTAANVLDIHRASGLSRHALVAWNIVPWYVGDGSRIRPVRRTDIDEALPSLLELLGLLPALRVVLLLGRPAARGWALLSTREQRLARYQVESAPHPSPTNLNTRPQARQQLVEAFARAAAAVDPPG